MQKMNYKKLFCIGKKSYVLLCQLLQTAPFTGEAAKLIDAVAEITSYRETGYSRITGPW
jgi:hypothetical protein